MTCLTKMTGVIWMLMGGSVFAQGHVGGEIFLIPHLLAGYTLLDPVALPTTAFYGENAVDESAVDESTKDTGNVSRAFLEIVQVDTTKLTAEVTPTAAKIIHGCFGTIAGVLALPGAAAWGGRLELPCGTQDSFVRKSMHFKIMIDTLRADGLRQTLTFPFYFDTHQKILQKVGVSTVLGDDSESAQEEFFQTTWKNGLVSCGASTACKSYSSEVISQKTGARIKLKIYKAIAR